MAALNHLPVWLSSLPPGGAYLTEVLEPLGGPAPRPRTQTTAVADAGRVEAIAGSGRKTLILVGVVSEIVVQRTALDALVAGYEVLVAVNTCGGIDARTEDAAGAASRPPAARRRRRRPSTPNSPALRQASSTKRSLPRRHSGPRPATRSPCARDGAGSRPSRRRSCGAPRSRRRRRASAGLRARPPRRVRRRGPFRRRRARYDRPTQPRG